MIQICRQAASYLSAVFWTWKIRFFRRSTRFLRQIKVFTW